MGNTIVKEVSDVTIKDLILPGVIIIIAVFVLIYKIVARTSNVARDINMLKREVSRV